MVTLTDETACHIFPDHKFFRWLDLFALCKVPAFDDDEV